MVFGVTRAGVATRGAGEWRPSGLTVRNSSAGGVLEASGDGGLNPQGVHRQEHEQDTVAVSAAGTAVVKAEEGGEGRRRGIQWFKGLREDLQRRGPLYKSDWTDGLHGKTLPAILFLYFACLAPAVAFGGISYGLTKGKPDCGGHGWSVLYTARYLGPMITWLLVPKVAVR